MYASLGYPLGTATVRGARPAPAPAAPAPTAADREAEKARFVEQLKAVQSATEARRQLTRRLLFGGAVVALLGAVARSVR